MQILKVILYILIVLGVLLGGIFAIGLLNFHGTQPAPEDAFKNKEPNDTRHYILSIQNELQRITDTAVLFKKQP